MWRAKLDLLRHVNNCMPLWPSSRAREMQEEPIAWTASPHGEVPHLWVLVGGVVEDGSHAKPSEHTTASRAEMVQH